jgi:hypothetical protein
MDRVAVGVGVTGELTSRLGLVVPDLVTDTDGDVVLLGVGLVVRPALALGSLLRLKLCETDGVASGVRNVDLVVDRVALTLGARLGIAATGQPTVSTVSTSRYALSALSSAPSLSPCSGDHGVVTPSSTPLDTFTGSHAPTTHVVVHAVRFGTRVNTLTAHPVNVRHPQVARRSVCVPSATKARPDVTLSGSTPMSGKNNTNTGAVPSCC